MRALWILLFGLLAAIELCVTQAKERVKKRAFPEGTT